MKVYVVMENDFPARVYRHEHDAGEFVGKMRQQQGRGKPTDPRNKQQRFRPIHWAVHELALTEKGTDNA